MSESRSPSESLPTPSESAPSGASTVLELRGADVLPVLHRISTQKLDDLRPGEARVTVFCDFRGRLLQRAAVALGPDADVWLLREDAAAEPLAAFIDRHVFREDLKIVDRSEHFTVIARPHHSDRPSHVERLDDVTYAVAAGDGVVLMAVPRSRGMSTDPADEERFRIGIGRAGHGHEIVEAFNPFEVGLGSAVHLDKGCFTGQEALMRLITYASVRRRLVRVRGEGPAPSVPGPVSVEGAEVGTMTSAIDESPPGLWFGLAVVKHDFATGTHALELEDGRRANVEVLPMPRAKGRP